MRRLPQLDFLRAVAIILVIGRHLEITRPGGPIGVLAEGWYRIGWIGVDLFFVLSGFLIGGLLITETRHSQSLGIRRFLVRRGFKIYPAYFVFLAYLLFLPVARAVVHGGSAVSELGDQWSTHWPHYVFLQNYIEVSTAQHLWSIGVEEHFYLALPLVVAALGFRHTKLLIPIGLASVGVVLGLRIISVVTDDPFSTSVTATHLRLDALLFGVALRAIVEYHPNWFAGLRRWRVPLVVFGIAAWAPNLFVPADTAWTRTIGLTLTLLGAGAFLVATYHSSATDLGRTRFVAEPAIRALCAVGVFSYAIYLWHVTVEGFLTKLTNRTITAHFGDGQLVWLVSATIVCLGILAFGTAMALAVEQPMLRIRDRIAPSRTGSLQVATPAVRTAAPTGARRLAAHALKIPLPWTRPAAEDHGDGGGQHEDHADRGEGKPPGEPAVRRPAGIPGHNPTRVGPDGVSMHVGGEGDRLDGGRGDEHHDGPEADQARRQGGSVCLDQVSGDERHPDDQREHVAGLHPEADLRLDEGPEPEVDGQDGERQPTESEALTARRHSQGDNEQGGEHQ